MICCYLAVFVDWGIEVFGHPLPDSADTFLMMGYAKAAITFVKYLPQVYLNWKRQSTDGFSIENVILDFTGGALSLIQSALLTIALGEAFFGDGAFNLVKFILSICSIFFDAIFFFQFWLYRGNKPKDSAARTGSDDVEGEGKAMLDGKQPYDIAPSASTSDIDASKSFS